MSDEPQQATRPSDRSADDTLGELDNEFAEVAVALRSAGSVKATLQAVVDLAVHTVEGCDLAGVFLLEDNRVFTSVHTDPLVAVIDALQQQMGEGPCLDAVAHGGTFYADDLTTDSRWTLFGPRAVDAGMRSVLALGLAAEGTRGALNLYARYPQAFGILDRAKALILVALAGFALSNAQTQEADDRRSDEFKAGLATREVIGQAQGILIEREHITANQAFDILRRASQHLNIKLRDIAQNLVDTGERPTTGEPPK